MGRINRKKSTKIVTFAVLLSLFAYFMLKDKWEMDKSRNEITSRDAVGLFRRGMYCHKTFTNESRILAGSLVASLRMPRRDSEGMKESD